MKHLTALLTALTTALTVLPMNVSADTAAPVFTYEVVDTSAKTARITGAENISGSVVIPQEIDGYKVTSIGDRAFFGNCDITSVTVPDGITEIGSFAFSGCLGLTDVKLSQYTEKLGSSCFLSCTALVEADLGNSLTAVPERCFYACTSLRWADIPETASLIGSEAYFSCPDTSGIRIPPSVKTIGTDAIGSHYNIRTKSAETIPGFNVTGMADTYAQFYAEDKGFAFTEDHGHIIGDTDLDGLVLAFDASSVLREYTLLSSGKRSTLSRLQRQNADFDNDGLITAFDASGILRAYTLASSEVG